MTDEPIITLPKTSQPYGSTSPEQRTPYYLLELYREEAHILATAYGLSASYFRWLHKLLTYPLIVLSAVSSVCAAGGVPETFIYKQYLLMGLSLLTLILAGFNTVINPQDKSNAADRVSNEFDKVSSDCRQFICENNKTRQEVKHFSKLTLELLETWKSLSPPIKTLFSKQAKRGSK